MKTEMFRKIQISSVSGIDDVPVDVSIKPSREYITIDDPAKLQATIEWQGNETVTFESGRFAPLDLPIQSFRPSPGLILLPDDHDCEREDDRLECWRLSREYQARLGHDLGLRMRTMDTDDSISCKSEIWSHFDYEGCLTPDKYQFRQPLCFRKSKKDTLTFNLEFTVQIIG